MIVIAPPPVYNHAVRKESAVAYLRQQLVWAGQYAALRVVEMLLQCFPIDANLATARWVGRLLYLVDRRHRRVAIANLRASFPGASPRAIRHMARRSFEHMIMVGVEFLCLTRLMQFNSYFRHIELGLNLDRFIDLVSSNRPCLIVGGHFGNWEMSAYGMAAMGFPTTSVGRPLDNPYLDRHVKKIREFSGQRILSKYGMTPEAFEHLEAGTRLAFPADQDAGRRGFFVEYFGRKASVYKSIAYLALESGAPIVVGGAYRTGPRFHYRGVVTDIIDPAEYEKGLDGAMAITQRFTSALERLVRMAPDQYLWVHRRWKTRPPEERQAAGARAS
jgi:KDO2-lipid IV(A) lauroyltransferase